jgi:hypothetical protein
MNAKLAAVMVLSCGVLGVLLGLTADGPQVKVSPPETKAGITCRVQGVSTTTTMELGGGQRHHQGTITLQLEGTAAYMVEQPEVTDVLDEREQDILVRPENQPDEPEEYARQRLENGFRNLLHQEGRQPQQSATSMNLKRYPELFHSIRGRVEAVCAKRAVREPVKGEVGAEAVEVAPGVTLLITRWDTQQDNISMSYEVRVRRGMKDVPAGCEPVFAGLVIRGPDGRIMQNLHYGQPVETRDEWIYVQKNTGLSRQQLEQGTLEACIFDGLERVRFEFSVTNLPVVTEAKP